MELIFAAIIIGLFLAIIALPFYLMSKVHFLVGLAVLGLYDMLLSKYYGEPVISIVVMDIIRTVSFLTTVSILIIGCVVVVFTVMGISPNSIPYLSNIMRFAEYYCS